MKTRYFEVSCIEDLISEETEYDTEYDLGWNAAINGIMKHVPQIDAVEVVRCKDCKWFDRISEKSCFGYCHAAKHCHMSQNWDISIYRRHKEDFYCADGERKVKE